MKSYMYNTYSVNCDSLTCITENHVSKKFINFALKMAQLIDLIVTNGKS